MTEFLTINEMQIHKQDYVCGFVFNGHESVALIKKTRPLAMRGKLNGIGGKIENNEKPLTAMVREFKEETGLLISEDRWLHYHTENFNDKARIFFFTALIDGDEKLTSITDEIVDLYQWKYWNYYHFLNISNTMYNLPYLIPMAHSFLTSPGNRFKEV